MLRRFYYSTRLCIGFQPDRICQVETEWGEALPPTPPLHGRGPSCGYFQLTHLLAPPWHQGRRWTPHPLRGGGSIGGHHNVSSPSEEGGDWCSVVSGWFVCSGLWFLSFISAISSQAIIMNVAWSMSWGVGLQNPCNPWRCRPCFMLLAVIVSSFSRSVMAMSSLKSCVMSLMSSYLAVGGFQ